MERIHDFAGAIRSLYRFRLTGTKLGLDNMERLCALLGHPERSLRFIHIAGTNGKGSTAAMLESILRHSGFRTGLFTSPHLVSFCERIQVDRRPVKEEMVASLLEEVLPAIEACGQAQDGRTPTFFEIVVALALVHFRREGVEWVLWETGMGGRLDATNIVAPDVSVITSIGWDHMAYLGDTLEKIAFEKAGIIKPKVPVVVGAIEASPRRVIEECARQRQSAITDGVGQITSSQADSAGFLLKIRGIEREVSLALLGSHQVTNAATTLSVIDVLRERGVTIQEEAIRLGLASVFWPARMHVLRREPLLLVDGAHNEEGARALIDGLRLHFPGQKFSLVYGGLKDKNWRTPLEVLAPICDEVHLVPVKSQRTEDPNQMEGFAANLGFRVFVHTDVEPTLRFSRPTVVAGSLFLAGEVLNILKIPGFEGELHWSEIL